MGKQIRITSETGPLRCVLMHTPGNELSRLTPSQLAANLIDDLISVPRAQEEFRALESVLRAWGVEVLQVSELLGEVMAGPDRRHALQMILGESYPVYELDGWSPDELVTLLITGRCPHASPSLPPLANMMFTRDSGAIVGEMAICVSPREPVRSREALICRALYTFHEIFEDSAKLSLHHPGLSIEGGDIMPMRSDVVMIGCGHRTHPHAVIDLGAQLLNHGVEHVFWVSIPDQRAQMHLDTVFTQTSETECVVYPPVVLVESAKGEQAASIIRLNHLKSGEVTMQFVPDLLTGLSGVGIELSPIPCGGDDPIVQEREQFWDGANLLTFSPGVVFGYKRCEATIAELGQHGYKEICVNEAAGISPGQGKYFVSIHDGEMSRCRGGAHCITQPLLRDDV